MRTLRCLLHAGMVWTGLAGVAQATDEHIDLARQADSVLNAVRARGADCSGAAATRAGVTRVANAGTAASTVATASDAPLVDRPPLRWHPMLAQAAVRHAGSMARSRLFDHVGMDGSTVRDRVGATGYRWQMVGENLAAGQQSLEGAVAAWLASPSHCTALLDARFTEFGLARVDATNPQDAYGVYWTLVLGRPR